jgi:hypothetical protein
MNHIGLYQLMFDASPFFNHDVYLGILKNDYGLVILGDDAQIHVFDWSDPVFKKIL